MRIMLATSNKGKLLELSHILEGQGYEFTGIEGFEPADDIETGSTFAENALIKARYYHSLSGLPVIADDSGLEVDALGGAPGIYSARYAGAGASDTDRVAKLLDELKDVPHWQRGARFVCAAAIRWNGGEHVVIEQVEGRILDTMRGGGGFGYDPVFYYEPLAKTFAELGVDEKAESSHRGRAFRRLVSWLKLTRVLDTAMTSDKIEVPAR